MSHANGQVKFKDGTVFHYEYNGTSDVVINCLYEKYEDMSDNWRKQPRKTCECGNDEPVEIATDYGYGFYWKGKACKKCKAITEGYGSGMGDNSEESDKLPEWWV